MRYILSPRNRPILEKFASGNVLLAFDFDGTLAAITSDPDHAAIGARTRKLLQKLTSRFPCIVVSGRGREDMWRRVRGIGFYEVIGNHGIEPRDSSKAIAQIVDNWVPILREKLKSLHGVTLENKQFSISVHYRRTRLKAKAVKAIKQVARTLKGAYLIGGKQVINIVPKGTPNKGLAVEGEMRRRNCEKLIYVGDDETDETVFARVRQGHLLGIRVGAKRTSLADFYVRDQKEIDRLLNLLLGLRES